MNQGVVDNPGLVNSEPYAGGWLCKIKLANPAQLDSLLDAGQYLAQISPA